MVDGGEHVMDGMENVRIKGISWVFEGIKDGFVINVEVKVGIRTDMLRKRQMKRVVWSGFICNGK
jgi:hypothetical protein